MEGFRKCVSFMAGLIAFFTFIAFLVVDDHLSKWEIVKTNLVYNNETSLLSTSQTPQYYILLNKYGSGNSETDYIDLVNQDCITIRINQPNKKFYNQAVFSKKTFYIFDNGGVTKPENFHEYIQYDEKAYTLKEFYENPPFEGDVDPRGSSNPKIMGLVTLGLVALCLIGFIPFEDYDFSEPFRKCKEKRIKKEYKEIFDKLKIAFKVKQVDTIFCDIDGRSWRIDIDHYDQTIGIKFNRDGILFDYRLNAAVLHDGCDTQAAQAFLKYKPKLHSLYNNVIDYVSKAIVDGVIPESNKVSFSI